MQYNNIKQNLPYKEKGKRMPTRKVSADRKGANIIIRKAKQKLLKYSDNTIKENNENENMIVLSITNKHTMYQIER